MARVHMLKEHIVPIAIIILAAGSSNRMRQPKGLLDWKGLPLLEHQCVEALQSNLGPTLVVTGAHATAYARVIPAEVSMFTNPNWASGRVSSILFGMKTLPIDTQGVLFLSIDQPCSRSTLNAVASGLADHPIAIANFRAQRGHPVAFSRDVFPSINRIAEQNQGLRSVIENPIFKVSDVEIDDPSVLWNLNTLEAYEHAVKIG